MPVNRIFRSPMSDAEKIATGAELAEQQIAMKQAEDDRSAARAAANDAVKIHRDRVRALATQLHEGHVEKAVACDWQVDIAAGLKRCLRLDTREVIETQPISPEERQWMLPFPDAEARLAIKLAEEEVAAAAAGKAAGDAEQNGRTDPEQGGADDEESEDDSDGSATDSE